MLSNDLYDNNQGSVFSRHVHSPGNSHHFCTLKLHIKCLDAVRLHFSNSLRWRFDDERCWFGLLGNTILCNSQRSTPRCTHGLIEITDEPLSCWFTKSFVNRCCVFTNKEHFSLATPVCFMFCPPQVTWLPVNNVWLSVCLSTCLWRSLTLAWHCSYL